MSVPCLFLVPSSGSAHEGRPARFLAQAEERTHAESRKQGGRQTTGLVPLGIPAGALTGGLGGPKRCRRRTRRCILSEPSVPVNSHPFPIRFLRGRGSSRGLGLLPASSPEGHRPRRGRKWATQTGFRRLARRRSGAQSEQNLLGEQPPGQEGMRTGGQCSLSSTTGRRGHFSIPSAFSMRKISVLALEAGCEYAARGAGPSDG